jgi:hypothetical protein
MGMTNDGLSYWQAETSLLCEHPDCRCFAALQQRLQTLSRENKEP